MNRAKIYLDWFRKDCTKQIKKQLPNYDLIKLSFLSLFYNHFLTQSYAIDTLLEPLFWFVDNFTNTLGPIFVFLVCFLIFLYVLIAYIIGLSFWLAKSYLVTVLALILGHYLLINALFHYFMAWKTNPGTLPSNVFIKNSVSICKKCILPKAVRTHHCSVCDKCILKMDHHCPWLNNCVGFFNHRYFFMFCMFAWSGTIFVVLFGIPLALNHYFNIDIYDSDFQIYDLFDYNNYLNSSKKVDPAIIAMDEYMQTEYFDSIKMNYQNVKNNCLIFEILLTASAFFAIGGLMAWHAKMITNGETCIESLRNKKERLKLKGTNKRFINPFDKGWKNNWRRFFGLNQKDIGWRCVFFPSNHKPDGDGIEWQINFK